MDMDTDTDTDTTRTWTVQGVEHARPEFENGLVIPKTGDLRPAVTVAATEIWLSVRQSVARWGDCEEGRTRQIGAEPQPFAAGSECGRKGDSTCDLLISGTPSTKKATEEVHSRVGAR